ncbi:MAG: glycosyltransferase family 4 protein [Chloroflexi bacterium]|nr:glycosyltransferase family 4 protein [Chloroflexota bacterium]
MRLFIATEQRFDRAGDGYYSRTIGGYDFWSRYLDAFDEVILFARASDQASVPSDAARVDGDGVRFWPLPDCTGAGGYLRAWPLLVREARRAAQEEAAFILRVPGAVGSLLARWLGLYGKPYAVEVVGDPHEVFAPGVVEHPLRPAIRFLVTWRLQRECARACAALYVTHRTLQRRYPCPAYAVAVSDVELPPAAYAPAPRALGELAAPFRLVSVGSLAQLYKAPDVLLEAAGFCVEGGLDLRVTFIGDGKYRPQLERQAAALGLGERVRFLGQLPAGQAVRERLDQADLFVLPSRTDGIPRAMLEAMARGLPCIGSTAGGIPELLPAEDMVPPGDSRALADKIREVLADPPRMARMSARNLTEAGKYRSEVLQAERSAFYRYVREETAKWLHARGRS